jgi:hypothetical protein
VFSGALEPEPCIRCPFGRAPGEAGVEAAGEALPKRHLFNITGAFYKLCWRIIKNDVVNAFACIFNLHTGPLHKLNSATISLLPKKELAERVSRL